MPVYTALSIGIFFAGLGLPGLCGFIGEVLVVLSVWNFSQALAVISAFVVILTAGYILWAIQRVYLGAEYRGPHAEALTPITFRELSVAVPLLVFAIWFGIYPMTVFRYMDATVDQQVSRLATWSEQQVQRDDGSANAVPSTARQPASGVRPQAGTRFPGRPDRREARSASVAIRAEDTAETFSLSHKDQT
jgi:NADH-quinone oxidoreductase subunit M